MPWFRRGEDEARIEELEALLRQSKELLEKTLEENKRLKDELDKTAMLLRGALRVFYPSKLQGLENAAPSVLAATLLRAMEEERLSQPIAQAKASQLSAKSTEEEPQFTEREREVFEKVYKGYCTPRSVGVKDGWRELEVLEARGYLASAKVKTGENKVYLVYFPTVKGLEAGRKLFGVDWAKAQVNELSRNGYYMSNEELKRAALGRFADAGYEVTSEDDAPSECTFTWKGGSHRADLVLWTIDTEGNRVKVYIECESMGNPLDQVHRMLSAYRDVFGTAYIVVSGRTAKRMMVQRAAWWAAKTGTEAFRIRIESVNRLRYIRDMQRFTIVLPKKRTR